MASWLSIMNIWCEKFEVALICCCYCCFDLLHQFVKIRYFLPCLLFSLLSQRKEIEISAQVATTVSGKLGKHLPEKCLTFLFVFCMIWFSSFWASLCSRHISPIDLSYACKKYQQSLESKQTAAVGRMSRMASFGFEYLLSSYHWAQKTEKEWEHSDLVDRVSIVSFASMPSRAKFSSSLYFPHFPRLLIFLDDVVVLPSLHALYTLFSFANWRHKLLTQHPPDALNIYLIYMMMIHAETQWDVDDEKGK